MSRSKKHKSKKSLILSDQKPKKRKKIRKKLKPLILPFFVISSFCLGLYLTPFTQIFEKLASYLPKEEFQTQIEIKAQLAKSQETYIRQQLSELETFDEKKAKFVLTQIQKKLSAKSIRLISTRPHSYQLVVDFHKPKLSIELGKKRYVNENGKIFGNYDPNINNWLPMLRGLQLQEKPELLDDQTLRISHLNQTVVDEALFLIEKSLSYNITYKDIFFDQHRGFKAELKNRRLTIEMGRKPFEEKLKRLVKIIEKLDENAVPSAHVELDFPDKAFVQELGS